MSVETPCEICRNDTIVDGCDRCGRLVCKSHYDRETGVCTDCLSELPGGGGERRNRDYPDGVDEYQF